MNYVTKACLTRKNMVYILHTLGILSIIVALRGSG